MEHSPGFLQMVNEARTRVREILIDEARERLRQNPGAVLVDVREESEWQKDHHPKAIHLGKGILERDIEKVIPRKETEIIMYCGGGFRSVLTADAARKMGYTNAASLIGGYKEMQRNPL
jgi:rhodanese-related sulfurtransferase